MIDYSQVEFRSLNGNTDEVLDTLNILRKKYYIEFLNITTKGEITSVIFYVREIPIT